MQRGFLLQKIDIFSTTLATLCHLENMRIFSHVLPLTLFVALL